MDIEKKVRRTLMMDFVESMYAIGVLDDTDIDNRESLNKAIAEIIEDGGIGSITVDHKVSLLDSAREYKRKDNVDLAYLFYAIYFEHQVNYIIYVYCQRNRIELSMRKKIIRSINIDGKFTWLLILLNFPPLKESHLKTILNLATIRNSFVHYKWSIDKGDTIEQREQQKVIDNENLINIEKAVKYFTSYVTKVILKGKRNHIKNLLKTGN